MNRNSDYGALEKLSKNVIKQEYIVQHWDDVLRLASKCLEPLVGPLKLSTVKAPEVMRVLARDESLSGLGEAVAEIGKVAKTLHLLRYVDDPTYRRRIHIQRNRGDRHRLARASRVSQKFRPTFHGPLERVCRGCSRARLAH